ncbi:15657_t:CDS:2 [Dentiscutata erythropus]|uniref:15657_t:CDS:1 n=1 Tax=Dentiscutata erythropus TaxID=1348616 RepID=A0A9N8VIY9_9GLOM|nr:15657_t:CDS:2 [Dentiscutata erythropus]
MKKKAPVIYQYHQITETTQSKIINNEKIVLKKGEAFFEKEQTQEITETKQCDTQIKIPAAVGICSIEKAGQDKRIGEQFALLTYFNIIALCICPFQPNFIKM